MYTLHRSPVALLHTTTAQKNFLYYPLMGQWSRFWQLWRVAAPRHLTWLVDAKTWMCCRKSVFPSQCFVLAIIFILTWYDLLKIWKLWKISDAFNKNPTLTGSQVSFSKHCIWDKPGIFHQNYLYICHSGD